MGEVSLFLIILALFLLFIAQLKAGASPTHPAANLPETREEGNCKLLVVFADDTMAITDHAIERAYVSGGQNPVGLPDICGKVYNVRLTETGPKVGSIAEGLDVAHKYNSPPQIRVSSIATNSQRMGLQSTDECCDARQVEFHQLTNSKYLLLPAYRVQLRASNPCYKLEVNEPCRTALLGVRSQLDAWS